MRLVEVKADYWRNRDGSIVHTNDCPYSGSLGSVPWHWADHKTRQTVIAVVNSTEWMRLCKKCFPGTEIGGDDE